ncbi:extracellular solute-binding protein [Paenibacillus pasadenensis]|uniref:extracellular solute-binding protein n=1 Tax=Paenibacillus pasadenensis TaxID=217090 RepID=UPI00203F99CE|nr:extracellular solute-binding protein [Paenibacillus pasadenensis]MCM3746246.1 extracellular solute-binding protein [Paenibacillus pasadenensis]
MNWGTAVSSIKGKKARRGAALGLSLVMASGVIAGCSGESSEQKEPSVVRIGMMYGSADNETWFRQQFTDTYELMNKNVTFEIVYANDYNAMNYSGQPNEKQPDPYEKMKDMLTGKNPVDVVVIDYPQLSRLTQDGMLQQLDPLIAKDKFDISDYVPSVIDGIKDAGDSKIYALTPTFTSSALFYNKKIFADAGVQPPADGMTWNQAFDLARKISKGSGKDQTFGLQFNRWGGDAYNDIQSYIAPLGLKVFDDKGEKMLVDSGTAWKDAWETMIKLYKDKVVPSPEDSQKIMDEMRKAAEKSSAGYNPYMNDLFNSGKLGMVIGDYYFVNELRNAKNASETNKSIKLIDWDVVTVPVFEEKPGVGGNINLSQAMGINAKAQNPDGAWDLIKFLNGRDWAKLKSRSTYEIPARQEFIKPIDGMQYNMKAFTTLKPIPAQTDAFERIAREKPGIYEMQGIGSQIFQEVLSGKKTVDEGIKEWAVKGNALLQKLKTNPKGSMGGGMEGGAVSGG